MPRVKRGVMTHKRHKKVISRAQGYWGARSHLFKTAKEAVMHAFQYAYRDRRTKKRDFRRLWITRISAACRLNGTTYNRFIEGLNKAGVEIDRKALADIAVTDAAAFTQIVENTKSQLSAV
jgi:large subunit ribosomal protein L20